MPRPRNSGPTRTNGKPTAPSIAVRCPKCRKDYTVAPQFAGRRARCAVCGAVLTIPKPAALRRPKVAASDDPKLPEVRIGCIGRGHAGKTALFQALGDGLIGDFLPSGLHLDAADPREVARMIREAEQARRLLEKSGLPPTLEVSQTRYCIYQGDERRVVCRLREVIGQVLTHTLPESDARLQARYSTYLRTLVNAQVVWVVIPCPPADPSPADRRRYAHDLRITGAYLREALRLRTGDHPAAVALILSKADALFHSAAEAQAALNEEVLRKALGPLVHLVEQSPHVSDAAVIPVSAFGFGKAVRQEDGTGRAGLDADTADDPFADEPIWLLREGETPEPYNLDTLFLWSLLLGLLSHADLDPELDALCRMLRDDLESSDPWLVPIKGGVVLEATT
jgi:ribosomal protein S27E